MLNEMDGKASLAMTVFMTLIAVQSLKVKRKVMRQVLWTFDTTSINKMLSILTHDGLPESGAHSSMLCKTSFYSVCQIRKCLPWARQVLAHMLKMKKTIKNLLKDDLDPLAHNELPESGAHSNVLSKIPFYGVRQVRKCLPWTRKVLTHAESEENIKSSKR